MTGDLHPGTRESCHVRRGNMKQSGSGGEDHGEAAGQGCVRGPSGPHHEPGSCGKNNAARRIVRGFHCFPAVHSVTWGFVGPVAQSSDGLLSSFFLTPYSPHFVP